MKKILLFSALFMLCWGLKAQQTALLGRDAIQVTPDTLHLYFFACSPHLERVTIANSTDELICINRVLIDEYHTEESTLDIPTSKYANGIYFIKANNMKERRFVVAH